eukprot:SAG31_NODE_976_length_10618_cov_3.277118_5_plen_69_part_00
MVPELHADDNQLFTLRAATIDYYMAKPRVFDVGRSLITGAQISRVPVIRIFGEIRNPYTEPIRLFANI